MDDDSLFFEVKTIGLSTYRGRKPQTLLDAARHNRRQIQAELGAGSRIEPTRTHLNQTLSGPDTPADVVELARSLMAASGYAPKRHDYTQAVELLFSIPAGGGIDAVVFFRDCLRWAVAQFGVNAILSADIHLDESSPHLHVLLAPIADGCYLGSKLITRVELAQLRESFAELALTYGLREPVRRLHGVRREVAARLVLVYLESIRDPLLQSALWFTVKPDIVSNPARYAARLGIVLPGLEVQPKRSKTMAQIFTSKGKGAKSERNQKPIGFELMQSGGIPKPIGFEIGHGTAPENIETIALLVSPKNTPPFQPQKAPDATDQAPAQSTTPVTTLASESHLTPAPSKTQSNAPSEQADAAEPAPAVRHPAPQLRTDVEQPGVMAVNSAAHKGRRLGVQQSDHDPAGVSVGEQGVTRERDTDQAARFWCEDIGKFIKAPPGAREAPQRAAHTSVAELLETGLVSRGGTGWLATIPRADGAGKPHRLQSGEPSPH